MSRPLGAVLERPWGLLEHLWSQLEASWAVLTQLGGHLGFPEALLEPSWANTYPPRGVSPRSKGGGEGASGRGKPLPEGTEGGLKRKLFRPPTPGRLVGLARAARRDMGD
eukprot:6060203-Pyramimonas_sp.AAC.1